MTESGRTEWGRRWLRICDLPRGGTRMARGQAYARAGAVCSLRVAPGEVLARVQGSRRHPYRVTMVGETLPAASLETALEACGLGGLGRDRLRACLQAGEWARLSARLGEDLFSFADGLDGACSCPDWEAPCKHAVAAVLTFADALDQDPALWLTFRFGGQAAVVLENPSVKGRASQEPVVDTFLFPGGAPSHFPGGAPSVAEARAAGQPVAVWGPLPAMGGGTAGMAAAPSAASPLQRLTAPPWWQEDDPDLPAVVEALCTVLAGVADQRDVEADMAAAFDGAQAALRARLEAREAAATARGTRSRLRVPSRSPTQRAFSRVPGGTVLGRPAPRREPPKRAGGDAKPQRSVAGMPEACPACAARVQPGWAYCAVCGTKLGPLR